MSDKRTRFRDLAEIVTAPAVAVLFWITVILIIVMTSARPKFFEANFFEAFGAIGQVAFAGAVFWLGWQQFQFTKVMAKRQHSLEAFPLRRAALQKIEEHSEIVLDGEEKINDSLHYQAVQDMIELEQLFDARVSDMFNFYVEALDNIIKIKSDLPTADHARRTDLESVIPSLLSDAYDSLFEVKCAMELEMKIVA